MEETELQELEGALQAAAPPPWCARPWDGTLGRSALRAPEKGPSELQASFSRRGYGNAGPEAAAIAALRNKAPDLIAALREARRLLRQVHPDYCRATCPGHWDGDGITWVPSVHEAICQDVAHFLEQPAAGPSSPLDPGEQNGKD